MKFVSLVLLAALAYLAAPVDVRAQGCGPSNPNCIVTTMPLGDASKRAASDEFVQNAIAAIPPPVPTAPGGTNGQIQYNNAGAFGGFTAGQDCTVNASTGAVNCTKLQNVPVTATGASTNDILYFNGTGWLHNTFVAVINAACTVSPTTCANIFGYVLPYWYGAVCDGVTNDTTAMQAAVTGAAGRKLLIPAVTCVITAHLNSPSNIDISGVDRDRSIIKQTGQDYIFAFANVDNIVVADLYLLGNRTYTSWSASNFGAFVISNSASHSGYTFRRLRLSNFNASYWMYGSQTAGTGSNLALDDIIVTSAVGDIPTDPTPTNNTNYAFVTFSGTGGVRWENTSLNNIQIDGTGLCFGTILFANSYKYSITNGRYLNMGGANTGGHCTNGLGATNAYGIAVYDFNSDGNPPSDGIISGNYILNPIAAGIYVVGDGVSFLRANNSNKMMISNNLIIGQTHTDVLLPRGAIAINLSTDVAVIGNTFYQNQTGINVAAQNAGNASVLANHCSSTAGSSICLQLGAGNNGSSNTDRRAIRGNYFDAATTAATFSSATGARFNFLDVSGNTIIGGTNGISFANQFVSGIAAFTNNYVSGTNSFASLTGSIFLNGNSNLSFTAAALPAATDGSQVFVTSTNTATACTAGAGNAMGFRQNGAWKCF
jgi:hypothetical protein